MLNQIAMLKWHVYSANAIKTYMSIKLINCSNKKNNAQLHIYIYIYSGGFLKTIKMSQHYHKHWIIWIIFYI